jgi:hypothetical protein
METGVWSGNVTRQLTQSAQLPLNALVVFSLLVWLGAEKFTHILLNEEPIRNNILQQDYHLIKK